MDFKKYHINNTGSVFRLYARKTRNHPWLFLGTALGGIGIQVAELVAPLYLKQFFNLLAGGLPSPVVVRTLLITLGLIAIVYTIEWLFRRVHIFSIMYLESAVMTDLYRDSFQYLIAHSHHFFTSQFSGTLTRRVSKFVHAYEVLTDSIMMQFFPTVLFVGGAVTILFLRNHTLGIILGAWVVGFTAFQLYLSWLRQPLRIARSAEDSRVAGTLADAISNHTTVTLFSGFQHELERFIAVIGKWRTATMRSWNADELFWSIQGILVVAIELGLLYGAIIFWEKGLLTIGDFVLMQVYLLGVFNRLLNINRELRRFYDAHADAIEMNDILNTPHDIKDRPRATDLVVTKGVVTFSDVSFYFNNTRSILNQFNLSIKSREKIALVGPSGAGKSTVIKLLLRLYDVSGGSITIDGQDIGLVTQHSLRDAISYVPQEPILFHRTLMENIRYGRRDATDEEVIEAAKKAHCHEFISSFPEKYETFVGERGVRLSGGERQRVAIARAILKNAPILILDEATSSLDSESESYIQDALQTLMREKTVVVIAHRLSTIMKMDRIVVIDDGKILVEGTHDELVKQGGLYQKLWDIQAGGFLK